MKKSILVFIALMVFFYLLGCFMEVSFNIADWLRPIRYCIAIFGLLLSMVLTGAFHENKNK